MTKRKFEEEIKVSKTDPVQFDDEELPPNLERTEMAEDSQIIEDEVIELPEYIAQVLAAELKEIESEEIIPPPTILPVECRELKPKEQQKNNSK